MELSLVFSLRPGHIWQSYIKTCVESRINGCGTDPYGSGCGPLAISSEPGYPPWGFHWVFV
jgi:hypothetical protein